MAVKKAKATIKKVASKLKKASKAHAGQAKALSEKPNFCLFLIFLFIVDTFATI